MHMIWYRFQYFKACKSIWYDNIMIIYDTVNDECLPTIPNFLRFMNLYDIGYRFNMGGWFVANSRATWMAKKSVPGVRLDLGTVTPSGPAVRCIVHWDFNGRFIGKFIYKCWFKGNIMGYYYILPNNMIFWVWKWSVAPNISWGTKMICIDVPFSLVIFLHPCIFLGSHHFFCWRDIS